MPVTQPADDVHLVAHLPVVESHRNGAHAVVTCVPLATSLSPSAEQTEAIAATHFPLAVSQTFAPPQSASAAQLVLQVVPPHAYGAQFVVAADGQAPEPSQRDSPVALPAAQVAAEHTMVAAAKLHFARSEPSHARAQTPVPSAAHAVREPCGAPLTGEQVPTLPVTSQASHCPLHAVSQQLPSTQNPDVQSLFTAHATPFS